MSSFALGALAPKFHIFFFYYFLLQVPFYREQLCLINLFYDKNRAFVYG